MSVSPKAPVPMGRRGNRADPDLAPVVEKVRAGERLTFDEGLVAARTGDLAGLLALAEEQTEKRHGKHVHFNINIHVNPSNVCAIKCKLCAFARTKRSKDAWAFSVDEIVAKARLHPPGATEIHMVGGLHPDFGIAYYEDLFRALRRELPQLHIQALTMIELDYVAEISGLSVRETIARLKAAGLGSVPGGGAEIFDRSVRDIICRPKISGERWLEVAEEVHRQGLKSNVTMLYGHVETWEHRIDHFRRIRELQDRTGGFQCLIPLPFLPKNTLLEHLSGPTPADTLRTFAVARLFIDNLPHLKAFWIMHGLALARQTLHAGCDDLDGTVVEEHIMHDAGATTPQGLTLEALLALIRAEGKVPVERDTVYSILRVYA